MSREKFEAWFKSSFHPDITGPYVKDQLFFAWQAAIASMQSERDQLAAQLKQSQIDAECYKRGMDASNKLLADVVADNAALKLKSREVLKEAAYVYSHYNSMVEHLDGESVDGQTLHELQELIEEKTPATDRFLAEQQSIGIQKAAASGLFSNWVNQSLISFAITVRDGDDFAAQLRNEVKV
jgi:hypothetical protein